MFDLSVCPEDLILLSRADASGKLDAPYDEGNEAFLRERLEDYRQVMARPMVTGKDLIADGMEKGPGIGKVLDGLLDMVLTDPSLNEREILLEKSRELRG